MSRGRKIHIVLADDHAIVLDGLCALLQSHTGITIVGKSADGHGALEILKSTSADILITDFSMGKMDGGELVKLVKKAYPSIKVIMLSMHDEPSIIQAVFRAGVDGYILKKHTHQELIRAIDTVMEGEVFITPEINKILMKKLPPEVAVQLTEREIDVLKLLVNELNTRQIGDELGISERTVETHRKNLMRKTNSQNIVGLIKFAHNQNII